MDALLVAARGAMGETLHAATLERAVLLLKAHPGATNLVVAPRRDAPRADVMAALRDAIGDHGALRELALDYGPLGTTSALLADLGQGLGRCATLKTVHAAMCGLDDAGASTLLAGLASADRVSVVDVDENALGAETCRLLSGWLETTTTLTWLSLSGTGIGEKDACAIGDALAVNGSLKRLDLSRNALGDRGVAAVARALEYNAAVEYLNVAETAMEGDGARAIAHMLQVNCTLTMINLEGNSIPADAMDALADALGHNCSLTTLEADAVPAKAGALLEENERLAVSDMDLATLSKLVRAPPQTAALHLGIDAQRVPVALRFLARLVMLPQVVRGKLALAVLHGGMPVPSRQRSVSATPTFDGRVPENLWVNLPDDVVLKIAVLAHSPAFLLAHRRFHAIATAALCLELGAASAASSDAAAAGTTADGAMLPPRTAAAVFLQACTTAFGLDARRYTAPEAQADVQETM